jgi:chromosome segregation ATPase
VYDATLHCNVYMCYAPSHTSVKQEADNATVTEAALHNELNALRETRSSFKGENERLVKRVSELQSVSARNNDLSTQINALESKLRASRDECEALSRTHAAVLEEKKESLEAALAQLTADRDQFKQVRGVALECVMFDTVCIAL